MKIYIITHKQFIEYTTLPLYSPLLVGAYKNDGEFNYIKDNSFEENISEKNDSYCELTGQYWIYKQSNEDIVGLCHYRRYFTKNKSFFPKSLLLRESEIRRILNKYDIILPQKNKNEYNGYTAKDFFNLMHDEIVWSKCRNIISKKYPDYLTSFDWFERQTSGYCYNMLISRKDLFDNYSEWLFDILFELESEIDLTKYDNYNTRMLGFVSERLINVWVHKNGLKVKEIPVVFTESNSKVKNKLKRL